MFCENSKSPVSPQVCKTCYGKNVFHWAPHEDDATAGAAVSEDTGPALRYHTVTALLKTFGMEAGLVTHGGGFLPAHRVQCVAGHYRPAKRLPLPQPLVWLSDSRTRRSHETHSSRTCCGWWRTSKSESRGHGAPGGDEAQRKKSCYKILVWGEEP